MLLIISLLFFSPSPLESIQCFECESGHDGSLNCNEPCEGELCVVWKWKTKKELQIKQGCLSGMDVAIGCRKNQVGAQLCVCDDGDFCNRVERAENTIQPLPNKHLPSVTCWSEVDGSSFTKKLPNTCRSNYCHYTRTTNDFGRLGHDRLTVFSCAEHPEFDFDLRFQSTVDFPGTYPNGLYRIAMQPNVEVDHVICSTNNCTSKNTHAPLGNTQCYVSAPSKNLTIEDTKNGKQHFCMGDYCFIQQSGEGLSKGCITVDESSSKQKMKSGYRRILSSHQWLCNAHLCNWDMDRMNRSHFPIQRKIVNFSDSYRMSFVFLFLIVYKIL